MYSNLIYLFIYFAELFYGWHEKHSHFYVGLM